MMHLPLAESSYRDGKRSRLLALPRATNQVLFPAKVSRKPRVDRTKHVVFGAKILARVATRPYYYIPPQIAAIKPAGRARISALSRLQQGHLTLWLEGIFLPKSAEIFT